MDVHFATLTGRSPPPLTQVGADPRTAIHPAAAEAFRTLARDAAEHGIQLAIASGHRDYERQRRIWNAKAGRSRALYDRHERPLADDADDAAVLDAILTWSAIPGASRHHWGTDFDIFDAAKKPRAALSLTQAEAAEDFAELYAWLAQALPGTPFFRPYARDRGGVAVEPWHLSYRPLATDFLAAYSIDVFANNIAQSAELALKPLLLERLEHFYQHYVVNICKT